MGEYGSGKTELAVTLALRWSCRDHQDTLLVDLDVVTPYFRSRERQETLTEAGVEVLYPSAFSQGIELPVLPPAIIQSVRGAERCVVDAGGGEAGTRVLGGLRRITELPEAKCIFVVNSCRPRSNTVEAIEKQAEVLQGAGRLQLDGIFANANVGESTDQQSILGGLNIIQKASESLDLPIVGVGVSGHLAPDGEVPPKLRRSIQEQGLEPVIIQRRMLLDWQ